MATVRMRWAIAMYDKFGRILRIGRGSAIHYLAENRNTVTV